MGKLNKSLYGSDRMDWETPIEIFNKLNEEFKFDLDPCCTERTAKCKRFYTPETDGLTKKWRGSVFMNPPYGRELVRWIRKAHLQVEKGNADCVMCLIPVRTDTLWWHSFVMKADEIRIMNQRVTFVGGDQPAPFPTAIIVFRRGSTHPKLATFDNRSLKVSRITKRITK